MDSWRHLDEFCYMYAGNKITLEVRDASKEHKSIVNRRVVYSTVHCAVATMKCTGRNSLGQHVQASLMIDISRSGYEDIFTIGLTSRGPHNPAGKSVVYSFDDTTQYKRMGVERQQYSDALETCIDADGCFVYNWKNQYQPVLKVVKTIDMYMKSFKHMQFNDYMEAMLR